MRLQDSAYFGHATRGYSKVLFIIGQHVYVTLNKKLISQPCFTQVHDLRIVAVGRAALQMLTTVNMPTLNLRKMALKKKW